MMIALRRLRTWGAFLTFAGMTGVAAAQVSETPLTKQLNRIDLGVSAIGVITGSTSGPDALRGNNVHDSPSNTVGALVNLRYIKSPLVGVEFNYTYSRFTHNYSGNVPNPGASSPLNLGIQANMSEYTLGYVVHTPHIFGLGTFASGGAGTTAFRPSKNGGEGFQTQARLTYYYNVGVEQQIFIPSFGFRASFRQAFYKAPDFETNYLNNGKRTITTEPSIGFYLHF
jgi:hypothetical protein